MIDFLLRPMSVSPLELFICSTVGLALADLSKPVVRRWYSSARRGKP